MLGPGWMRWEAEEDDRSMGGGEMIFFHIYTEDADKKYEHEWRNSERNGTKMHDLKSMELTTTKMISRQIRSILSMQFNPWQATSSKIIV